MHKSITEVMRSGVRGVEIVLGGKIPGSRAKSWRILSGYMKKCGDIAVSGVQFARASAQLKSGTIGIKVKIMPSNLYMPDTVKIKEEEAKEIIFEEKTEEKKEEKPKETKTEKKKERKPRQTKKKNDKEIKNVQGTE